MKQKVLLDTNFILIPAKFKVDIYSEINRVMEEPYELYVLDKSLDELDSIIETSKGKEKAFARLGKAILKAKKPKTLKTTSKDYVDNIILGLDGYIVATVDHDLRAKLKKRGVRTIVLRQKRYLVLD
jgi:rRNA-processing protein FCF1